MTTTTMDQEIIARYTDQPDRMPAEVRMAIEGAWGGRPVQLYALTDLDAGMRFTEVWLALGEEEVALARREGTRWTVRSIPRARIKGVLETPGLSGNTLTLLAEADEPAMAVVRYTHRQRRAVENVRFVLQQELEGRTMPPSDPDEEYARSVAAPIREAQALVAGSQTAVLWRLMGYLGRYRKQMVLGFAAATLITGVSSLPPCLAVSAGLGAVALTAALIPAWRAASVSPARSLKGE